jgi:gamma-glutamyltranspeptidase/glutathione hydrolase
MTMTKKTEVDSNLWASTPGKQRGVVMSTGGMVASAHPLVTATGIEVLQRGGNAMDAAIAMAGVSCIVLPAMCGLGGDTFLIHYDAKTRQVEALNGSGIAPYGATLEHYAALGYTSKMPLSGPLAVAVPGSPDAFATAMDRWGSWTLEQVLEPAINYAENGFPVSELLAGQLRSNQSKLAQFPETARTFLKQDGSCYQAGELFRQPDYAASLRLFAQQGAAAFYWGEIADRLVQHMAATGGLIGERELREHRSDIYQPEHVDYRGYQIYQTSPPSQGLIMLEEMAILAGFDLAAKGPDSGEAVHLMVEAKKLAYADRLAFAQDPKLATTPFTRLFSPEYAARRRQAIDPLQAARVMQPGDPDGDTTSFVVVDKDGNAVSFIHSLSLAFGSGVTIPGTGILLNNRAGRGFVLDPDHPNCLAPGKKTMHTLNTYLVTWQGEPYLVGNTPGGDGQPQWNMQTVVNCLDFGMSVFEAVTAPRWTSVPGTDPATIEQPVRLRMESRFPKPLRDNLAQLGHEIQVVDGWAGGGSVQLILIDPRTKVRYGASDPRGDGSCIGY